MEAVRRLNGGKGVDYVIECSGAPDAVNEAGRMLQPRRQDLPRRLPARAGAGRRRPSRAQQHLRLRHPRRGHAAPPTAPRPSCATKRFDARLIHTHTFKLRGAARGPALRPRPRRGRHQGGGQDAVTFSPPLPILLQNGERAGVRGGPIRRCRSLPPPPPRRWRRRLQDSQGRRLAAQCGLQAVRSRQHASAQQKPQQREGKTMSRLITAMPSCGARCPAARRQLADKADAGGGHEHRPSDECHRRRAAARRLLRRGDGRHLDLVRHAGRGQHRPSRLHHPGLLHRLYRQHPLRHRSDPDRGAGAAGLLPAGRGGLSALLLGLRAARPGGAARPRLLLRPAVHHRGGADPGVRRRLPLRRGRLHRPDLAPRLPRFPAADAGALRRLGAAGRRRCSSILTHTFIGRAIMAVAQDQLALRLLCGRPDPHQAHRLRHLDRHRGAGRRPPHHHPAGRALGRPRVHRPRVRHLRAGRHGQPAGHA